ncbi:hypothetical protein C5F47_01260 [Nitrosopumilus cobalaminigenes]|uniref:Uncharacterized protein n=1 Tax=Nitrosopumilus cobalaminigenes TaxID=1470066 RepID=A0A7D5LYG7_9ARCH|nr:hypothetical protein [Nitrosopumilus cobalaminigenes]QLH02294.1 hypothetical protein C5F47_01260 [Nitrosopumilus cobalaminigenes]
MTANKNSEEFHLLDQLNKKYFTELEHSVPHIQQTLFDLQNECYKTWRNAVTANTSLYKEFLSTSGYNFMSSKDAKDIFENMSEEGLKFRSLWNKFTISNIESVKNNAKTWNDNADAFVELNRKIMHYWLSAFNQTRN